MGHIFLIPTVCLEAFQHICTGLCWVLCLILIWSSQESFKVHVIIPILQRRKLRCKEISEHTQNHTASKWRRQNGDTGPPDLTAPSAQGSSCSVVSRAAVYPPHLLRAPHLGMGQVGRTSHSSLCLPSGCLDPGPATFQSCGPSRLPASLGLSWL